jgi:hypothetical protein
MEKTGYENMKASVQDIITEYFENKKNGVNTSNFTCTRVERTNNGKKK